VRVCRDQEVKEGERKKSLYLASSSFNSHHQIISFSTFLTHELVKLCVVFLIRLLACSLDDERKNSPPAADKWESLVSPRLYISSPTSFRKRKLERTLFLWCSAVTLRRRQRQVYLLCCVILALALRLISARSLARTDFKASHLLCRANANRSRAWLNSKKTRKREREKERKNSSGAANCLLYAIA